MFSTKIRSHGTAAILFLLALPLSAQTDSLDPAFARVPFDQWRTSANQAQIKWKPTVAPVILSVHQRLLEIVTATVDGREIVQRLGNGEMVLFVELTDAAGHRFQSHTALDLAKMREGIQTSELQFTDSAFVLPGNFDLTLALYCTSTKELSLHKERLRVAGLHSDPLPHAWDGLPPVEFRAHVDSPDSWLQPQIQSRLKLSPAGEPPSRVDVLLNLTLSERRSSSQRSEDVALSSMLPAFKVLSGVDWGSPARIALLDLADQRIPFEQDAAKALDWPSLRDALTGLHPGQVDVKTLEQRPYQASYFVKEVAKRLGPRRAIIVLSAMVEFEPGEELRPIEKDMPAGCNVYYLRFHRPLSFTTASESAGPRRSPHGAFPSRGRGARPVVETDQLAALLKPLGPRILDIESAQQFRSALAAILAGY